VQGKRVQAKRARQFDEVAGAAHVARLKLLDGLGRYADAPRQLRLRQPNLMAPLAHNFRQFAHGTFSTTFPDEFLYKSLSEATSKESYISYNQSSQTRRCHDIP
jgi:hypothetical protein